MSDARFRSSRSALSHPFHDETVKRMGHPARKIAAITLKIWKKGEAFDAELMKLQAA